MIAKANLQGHWRRVWLRAPGFEDATTRVHWLQAGVLFADIRVPLARPDLSGARDLADLDPPELLALMAAEGFAGTIAVEHGICTWKREINWHGRPTGIDAGRMRLSGADLVEDGVHADYRELWRREPGPPLLAHRIAVEGQSGVLVSSDTCFLLGFGDPMAAPSAPLLRLLEQGERPAAVLRHFRAEYLYGRWEGAVGIAELATNPFREGQPVLDRHGGALRFVAGDSSVALA